MPGAARSLLMLAAGFGLATVVLAALGAHAIAFADDHAVRLWNTATAMLGLHAVALLGIAAVRLGHASRLLPLAGLLMVGGSALFCGTLLLRSVGADRLPGGLAPAGGVLLMAGWVCLGLTGVSKIHR